MLPDRKRPGPHYFFGSVTRNSDLWQKPFDVSAIERSNWATGDFVLGRVTGKRNRLYHCETKSGRMANLVRGDLMIGALGKRAATLEGVGDWQAIGDDLEMDALTSAGLLGKATSTSPLLPDLVRLEYRGHISRGGNKLGMRDFLTPVTHRALTMPVILLIGTSMSAGKTTSGQVIIRALRYQGYKVVGAKLTGAARFRDVLSFRDAGASEIFDFVDAGLPSTVCPESGYRSSLDSLLSRIEATGADVLVAEAGASPLESYNGSVMVEVLRGQVCFTVLCASDPYAVLGVQTAFGKQLIADLVSGPAANTVAAVSLVEKLTGLPALNLLDRNSYPALTEMLEAALKNTNHVAEALGYRGVDWSENGQ
jgi:hypothetical protein